MSAESTSIPDRRALGILFDTYWTPSGWRNQKSRSTRPEDFQYAKNAGLMFDEVVLSHADIVDRAHAAVRDVDRRPIADAFVVSLSSRRLDLRSALGSFAVLQHFPRHRDLQQRGPCPVCGAYNRTAKREDLNVLNFERLKWGGVRHDQPLYASVDLQLFRRIPPVVPSLSDVRVLKGILQAIDRAPPKTPAASLEKHFAKAFKSNKPERDIVVGILGLCGILGTPAHPGYQQGFVPSSARELPPRRFVDMLYPACWWRRSDGICQQALAYWFGHLL